MNLKNVFVALTVAIASLGMLSTTMDAQAKRLGGGRPAGMQRQMPPKQPAATPNQATPTTPAAPAQAGKRSWMGPIAGIAAGLGIAALMSHLGMGEAFGNFMMMALLGLAALFVFSWLMKRFSGATQNAGTRGMQIAGAGAAYPQSNPFNPPLQRQASGLNNESPAFSSAVMPAGFDTAGFERIAKMIFIRLQAANDDSNVEDIRKFTTPELFASLRLDLQERGSVSQQTDVMQLDAALVDAQQEASQWVASVQFSGLIREEADAGAQPFKELWHLVKPTDDSREWAIAGITPWAA